MKADQYGTLTEQKRWQVGWYGNTWRPKCEHCLHFESRQEKPHFYCGLGQFATETSAACRQFEKRP